MTQHQDKLIRTVKLRQRGTGAVRLVETGGELESKGHNNIFKGMTTIPWQNELLSLIAGSSCRLST